MPLRFVYDVVRFLDIGGVDARFYVSEQTKSHKTFMGGVISLFLYFLSLSYGAFIMYQWFMGDFISRVQNTTVANNYTTFKLLSDKVNLKVYSTNPALQSLDPFAYENNILMAVYFLVNNSNITGPFAVESSEQLSGLGWHKPGMLPGILSINQDIQLVQTIQNNADVINRDVQIIYMLSRCQENNSFGYKCANDTFIDQYLMYGMNLISLSIKSQQIQNEVSADLLKEYFFSLNPSQTIESQVILRTKNLSIDNGVLLPQVKTYNLIDQSEVVSSVTPKTFSKLKFGLDAYFTTLIRLDSFQTISQEVSPKLGEIFANIFSIVQLLFMARYIIMYLNGRDFDNKFVEDNIKAIYKTKAKNLTDDDLRDMQKLESCQVLRKAILRKLNIYNVYHELIKLESQFFYLLEQVNAPMCTSNIEQVQQKLDIENSQNQEGLLIHSTKPSAQTSQSFAKSNFIRKSSQFTFDKKNLENFLRIDADL